MPDALLVEDDASSLEALERLMQKLGFTTRAVQTVAQAKEEIEEVSPELAILDLDLPDGNGMELLELLKSGFDTEIVVVTGHGSIDSAVQAMRAGALDYLTKPLDPERFEQVMAQVQRTIGLRQEVSRLRDDLRRLGRFDRMVGGSPAMQRVYDLVTRVARTGSTVLLRGETGTGKDMVAQAIHRLGPRSEGPFVAVNCGAIQPSLIESELFGHEQGSFTGARGKRRGLFEQADGGTLFLDEITEMPSDLQVKLLRVLETRTFQRVGGEKAIEVDVRLVAATNRSPEEAVEEGKLREDLFYRLNVFPIEIPPLRAREGDVELLAEYFLESLNEESEEKKQFESEALQALREQEWPGNVRELRNVVERAFILAKDRIGAEHVVVLEPTGASSGDGIEVEVGSSIAEVEKDLILATLERLGGDKKKAAATLGISLKTLYNRLNAYGMGRSANSS